MSILGIPDPFVNSGFSPTSPFVSGYSPLLLSGAIGSGQIAITHLASGAVRSGYILPQVSALYGMAGQLSCCNCGSPLSGYRIDLRHFLVATSGESWCTHCAGFNWEKSRFYNREDAIREGIPLSPDTPAGIVADYLEDQLRSLDADYMRKLMQTSGG